MAKALNFENFDEAVKSGVSLVDFWAEWCGPCQQVLPIIEELSSEFEGKATIAKVNVDEAPELAARFRVMSIPTILIFKDGELAEAPMIWVKSKEELTEAINKYL